MDDGWDSVAIRVRVVLLEPAVSMMYCRQNSTKIIKNLDRGDRGAEEC